MLTTFFSIHIRRSSVKNFNEPIIPIDINLSSSDCNYTGLAYAKKCTIVQEKENDVELPLSDYDNANYYSEQNNKIRSQVDSVSLNTSMTSSVQANHCLMTFTGEQLNKQDTNRTNEQRDEEDDYDDDDDYFIVDQQKPVDQFVMMNNESEIAVEDNQECNNDDEHFESTRLYDNGEHDGMLSDESQFSDDLRSVCTYYFF